MTEQDLAAEMKRRAAERTDTRPATKRYCELVLARHRGDTLTDDDLDELDRCMTEANIEADKLEEHLSGLRAIDAWRRHEAPPASIKQELDDLRDASAAHAKRIEELQTEIQHEQKELAIAQHKLQNRPREWMLARQTYVNAGSRAQHLSRALRKEGFDIKVLPRVQLEEAKPQRYVALVNTLINQEPVQRRQEFSAAFVDEAPWWAIPFAKAKDIDWDWLTDKWGWDVLRNRMRRGLQTPPDHDDGSFAHDKRGNELPFSARPMAGKGMLMSKPSPSDPVREKLNAAADERTRSVMPDAAAAARSKYAADESDESDEQDATKDAE